jgi:hypothetical protein
MPQKTDVNVISLSPVRPRPGPRPGRFRARPDHAPEAAGRVGPRREPPRTPAPPRTNRTKPDLPRPPRRQTATTIARPSPAGAQAPQAPKPPVRTPPAQPGATRPAPLTPGPLSRRPLPPPAPTARRPWGPTRAQGQPRLHPAPLVDNLVQSWAQLVDFRPLMPKFRQRRADPAPAPWVLAPSISQGIMTLPALASITRCPPGGAGDRTVLFFYAASFFYTASFLHRVAFSPGSVSGIPARMAVLPIWIHAPTRPLRRLHRSVPLRSRPARWPATGPAQDPV